MNAKQLRDEWNEVPDDPDPVRDLGYRPLELDVFEVNDGTDRFMILPMAEDMLEDEAFIVTDTGVVRDLEETL